MRFRYLFLCLLALAALMMASGCGRYDASLSADETDDTDYRQGKELLRQGRNQEALASFLKVVDKRGSDAPESHLELGILYQQHIKDPIAAIYHYKKYRDQKPNTPQSDLVRQRIDAATREFARTLPAQPLENQMERIDFLDKIDQLQRENTQLKDQIIELKTQRVNTSRSPASSNAVGVVDGTDSQEAPYAIDPTDSPITSAPEPEAEPIQMVSIPVAPPSVPTTRPTRPTTTPPTPSGRRYVVVKGDTLYAIAKLHYGSATNARVQAILNANRNVLPNASALHPGMTLIIP